MQFPRLPTTHAWAPNILLARDRLVEIHARGAELIALDDVDPIRLQLQLERIAGQAKQLLKECEGLHGLRQWARLGACALAVQARYLNAALRGARDLDSQHILHVHPLQILRTGRRGRPAKVVNRAWLKDGVSARRRLRLTTLASLSKVSRPTLRKNLRSYGLRRAFSDIDDDELDALVRYYKLRHPAGGLRYVIGFLQKLGVRVQRWRVSESMGRVDAIGRTLRRHAKIQRRRYKVKRPNALWHVDGHHKLIRWGIVVHAFIDGHSRVVTGAKASNNNRAKTVLRVFQKAVRVYGWPWRVRGDRGRENTKVALVMVMHRGLRRASFIWGTSPRNSRIERFWVEFGERVGHYWRAFFTRLERCHHLDAGNSAHRWLLQMLFLDSINEDVESLMDEWNHHPVSGAGGNMLPVDRMFVGQTQLGVYADELQGVHPEVIEQYYGVDESDEEDITELADRIERDQAGNVHAEPISVPDAMSPFETVADEEVFKAAVSEVQAANFEPPLFLEALEDGYMPYEWIRYGLRGKKELQVSLPHEVWYTRALLWSQALHVLSHIIDGADG